MQVPVNKLVLIFSLVFNASNLDLWDIYREIAVWSIFPHIQIVFVSVLEALSLFSHLFHKIKIHILLNYLTKQNLACFSESTALQRILYISALNKVYDDFYKVIFFLFFILQL